MHFRKSQPFRGEILNNNEMSDFFISNENSPFLKLPYTEILSFSDHEKNILNSKLFDEIDVNKFFSDFAEKSNPESLVQDPSLFADAESFIFEKKENAAAQMSFPMESATVKKTISSDALPCPSSTLPCPLPLSPTLPCPLPPTLPCPLPLPPTDLLETSIEYRMAVQERLNVRLKEQLHSWVQAQIELHQQLSEKESFQSINSNQKSIYEGIFDGNAFPEKVKNENKNDNDMTNIAKTENKMNCTVLKIIKEKSEINCDNDNNRNLYNDNKKNIEIEDLNIMTACSNNDISYLSQNKMV